MTFHAFLLVGRTESASPGCFKSQISSGRSCAFLDDTNRSVSLRRLTSRAGVPSRLGRSISLSEAATIFARLTVHQRSNTIRHDAISRRSCSCWRVVSARDAALAACRTIKRNSTPSLNVSWCSGRSLRNLRAPSPSRLSLGRLRPDRCGGALGTDALQQRREIENFRHREILYSIRIGGGYRG